MTSNIMKTLIAIVFIAILLSNKAIAQDQIGVSETGDTQPSTEAKLFRTRRSCIPNGCRCYPGTPQGQYCLGSNVYECNPRGGCCLYGYRESCARCGKLRC